MLSINIPSTVTHVGSYAFAYCTSLEMEVVLPKGQTVIEPYTFYYCQSLPKIFIPSGVTDIGEYAFYYCSSIKELTIPAAVRTFGQDAFSYCTGVTTLYYNATNASGISGYNNNNTATNSVFYNLGSYNGMVIIVGKRVEKIPDYFMFGIKNLKSVTFEEGSVCEAIGTQAFYRCSGLEILEIPANVTTIPSYLLTGCTSLKELTIPFVGTDKNATEASENTLFIAIFGSDNYSGMAKVTQYYKTSGGSVSRYVPATLTKITVLGGTLHYGAMSSLTYVTEIHLGKDVTVIGEYAFRYCQRLADIHINGRITSIGADAFVNCTGLARLFLSQDASAAWDQIEFGNENSNPLNLGATIVGVVTPGSGGFVT
jgi:hypothetical protein